jgi:hypothetical protein
MRAFQGFFRMMLQKMLLEWMLRIAGKITEVAVKIFDLQMNNVDVQIQLSEGSSTKWTNVAENLQN